MATGDLSNNIRKLKAKLKAIKYAEEIDVHALADGTPASYLPIYHYAFTSFSPALAEKILGKDIELYGKSDARFMEAIYKVLRDMFSYKPPVTKEQFFAKGFVERKVIMCTEILQMVKDKHVALNPAPSKTALKTGVRPRSAVDSRYLATAVPKTKGTTSTRLSPRQQDNSSSSLQPSPRSVPHVVNELTSAPVGPTVRHVAKPYSHTNPVRHVAGVTSHTGHGIVRGDDHNHSSDREDMPRQVSSLSTRADVRPVRHVSIQSPTDAAGRTPSNYTQPTDRFSDDGSPEHLRPTYTAINTPSISRVCRNSVEVVSIPRGHVDEQQDVSIMEIRAATSDSVLQAPVPQSEPEVNSQITNLYQTIEVLTDHVLKFDTTLKEVQQSSAINLEPYLKPLQENIDNLMARMVLLENRVSIIESKVVDCNKPSAKVQSEVISEMRPFVTTTTQPSTVLPSVENHSSSFAADLKSLSAGGHHESHLDRIQSLFGESTDVSLNYSPIRKTVNGVAGQMLSANEETFATETEDDARRSSTPTMGGSFGTFGGDSSLCCKFNDTDTNDAVSRIRNMMKETKMMMKERENISQPETTT